MPLHKNTPGLCMIKCVWANEWKDQNAALFLAPQSLSDIVFWLHYKEKRVSSNFSAHARVSLFLLCRKKHLLLRRHSMKVAISAICHYYSQSFLPHAEMIDTVQLPKQGKGWCWLSLSLCLVATYILPLNLGQTSKNVPNEPWEANKFGEVPRKGCLISSSPTFPPTCW